MTRSNPYTQRQLERVMKAAKRCGMRAIVKPDGSIVLEEISPNTSNVPLTSSHALRDAREKLGVH